MGPLPVPRRSTKPAPTVSAFDAGLRMIVGRDHSVAELRRKLGRRGYPDVEIDAAQERLMANGWLGDRRFAERYARRRSRSLGPMAISAELAARGVDRDTRRILDRLVERDSESILALNKIDLVRREGLLGLADALSREGRFDPVFMISGRSGDGVDELKRHLAAAMPPGPWLFPEDQLSDATERLIAAEVTREQIFLQLRDELPYGSMVETEQWEDRKDGGVRIEQVIFVQRPSQRAIVLGQGGRRIKAIGGQARAELERILERRVHLFLFVKVRENWIEDRERYTALGLDYDV